MIIWPIPEITAPVFSERRFCDASVPVFITLSLFIGINKLIWFSINIYFKSKDERFFKFFWPAPLFF